jgi:heat-inducible transcriptional repressor
MAENKVLVVMAMESGIAKTILVEVEASIKEDDLIVMTSVLNEKLCGLTVGELRRSIQERLAETDGNPQLLRLFVETESDLWQGVASGQLHLIGTENIINKPEFSDRVKLQEFIKLIGSRTNLIDLFSDRDDESGIVITIGAENRAKEIQSCSVVSATYRAGSSTGTIGIIGPTRMPYAKLVSVVHYAARQLNDVLSESKH